MAVVYPFLVLFICSLISRSIANKVVKDLTYSNVTIFQGNVANIHKKFELILPLGLSQVVITTADTIDPSSIRMNVIPKDINMYKDIMVRLFTFTHMLIINSFIHSGKSQ